MITSFRIPGAVHQPAFAKPSAQRPQAPRFSCNDEPKDTYSIRFAGESKSQAPAEKADKAEADQNELNELIRRTKEQLAVLSSIRQNEKDGSRPANASDHFIEHAQIMIAKMSSFGEAYIGKKD